MNTLRSRHKQCHFNCTKSPLNLVKLKMAKNGRPVTPGNARALPAPNATGQSLRQLQCATLLCSEFAVSQCLSESGSVCSRVSISSSIL